MTTSKCPNCDSEAKIGVEYAWNHPHHYDGISEWLCELCRTRWGRWSGRVLKDGEWEPRYGALVANGESMTGGHGGIVTTSRPVVPGPGQHFMGDGESCVSAGGVSGDGGRK